MANRAPAGLQCSNREEAQLAANPNRQTQFPQPQARRRVESATRRQMALPAAPRDWQSAAAGPLVPRLLDHIQGQAPDPNLTTNPLFAFSSVQLPCSLRVPD